MNYGSCCSGVEAATLAWEPLGWKPRFFAEVEPFPAAVLCHRFGATRPLRPLDPNEATNEKDRKLREGWRKQIAELPPYGTIPNLGDFTKIRNDDYDGAIDLLVGGTPCFPAGNLVLTEYGYKPIEDVQVGDLVMTHLGRLRRVLATGNKIADNVGKCRVVGRPEFSVTGNHPFWVCPDARSEPEFRAVEDSVGLYAGQLDGFPISPTASKDIYRKDRWTFGRILSFKPTGIPEAVYNLETEDDNSYIANGICVHNCQSYSVAGLRKGLADPRGNLALEFVKLAYRSNARWTVWENVPYGKPSIRDIMERFDYVKIITSFLRKYVPIPILTFHNNSVSLVKSREPMEKIVIDFLFKWSRDYYLRGCVFQSLAGILKVDGSINLCC